MTDTHSAGLDSAGSAAAVSPATVFAAELIDEFIGRGVAHLVVSPGSRSQALALVAAARERSGVIALHVRLDERIAGFTALGIARETGAPALVVCTSGTAVANLAPAVWEAHHAGVPMIVLTADRPPELRGIGANQTTQQVGAFGSAVRWDCDAATPSDSGDAIRAAADLADHAWRAAMTPGAQGPVHLNLPFREPLSSAAVPEFEAKEAPDTVSDVPAPVVLHRGPRTVVIAGADAGPEAEEIANSGGWPLVAEITSGSRYGRFLVHGYRGALRVGTDGEPSLGDRVERAIVFGHPTLTREVTRLLSRTNVEVIAVAGPGERLNLNGQTTSVAAVQAAVGDIDRVWLGEWMAFSSAHHADLDAPAPDLDGLHSHDPRQRSAAMAAELSVIREPITRPSLAAAVWRATWPHDRLVFGSSRLIREADQTVGGKKISVHANRGLAGIDGTIATATGIAVASQRTQSVGVTRVVLGDLAMLHDVGALLLGEDEPIPRMQIIVGNDNGGSIFEGLEVAATAPHDDFDRVMRTPQRVSLEHLAAAYGWQYARAQTRGELDQALTDPTPRRVLVEVPLAR